MTTINKADVEKIAHLARLSVSEKEIPEYARNLSNILELAEKINNANTDNLTPMAHPLESLTQRLRPDEITESNQRERFQAIAPSTEAGVYLVPKVIED
ncbi:MAG: Asp-tRNA(Asn)/Glu-tRNA(Gln) amidotransferase subunit GatC [Candidatus Berkiella sp.]